MLLMLKPKGQTDTYRGLGKSTEILELVCCLTRGHNKEINSRPLNQLLTKRSDDE